MRHTMRVRNLCYGVVSLYKMYVDKRHARRTASREREQLVSCDDVSIAIDWCFCYRREELLRDGLSRGWGGGPAGFGVKVAMGLGQGWGMGS